MLGQAGDDRRGRRPPRRKRCREHPGDPDRDEQRGQLSERDGHHHAQVVVPRHRDCLTRIHESTLDSFVPAAEDALRLLAKLPGAPTSVREVTQPRLHRGGVPRTADVVPVHFNGDAFRYAQPGEWRTELVAGAGTPTCFNQINDEQKEIREAAARTAVAAWFTGELKPLRASRFIREGAAEPARLAWEALRSLPADQQVARVSAARAVGLSCQGDQLTALTNGEL